MISCRGVTYLYRAEPLAQGGVVCAVWQRTIWGKRRYRMHPLPQDYIKPFLLLGKIQGFAAKQSTRDEIKIKIKDYLWDERTGLPESFAPEEVDLKTDMVFQHIIMAQRYKMALSY